MISHIRYELLPKRLETYEKYCKILRWGRANPTRFMEDFLGVSLTDHQKWILLSSWVASNCCWVCSRSSGKAECLNTKVYLANGATNKSGKKQISSTIGQLKVGDRIYDESGKPVTVCHLNPIIFDEVYEVEFEDGEKIECNADHLWYVFDRDFDKNNNYEDKWVLRNTDFIYHNFLRKRKDGHKDYRFHVPLTKPVEFAKNQRLPIDPYLLGLWLGDGTSASNEITSHKDDKDEIIGYLYEKGCNIEGCVLQKKIENGEKVPKNCYKIKVGNIIEYRGEKTEPVDNAASRFRYKLKKMGLLNNKHIPDEYLYGDVEVRLELLQGLMDTDGTVDKLGHCEFTQTRTELANQVLELITSLGMDGTLTFKEHTNYIKKDGTEAHTWRIYFTASKELPVFKMKRKYDKLPDHPLRNSQQKAIVNVRKTGERKAMRCITVANKSGLYLCGNKYTVTHNSFMSAPLIMARSLLISNHNTYILAPSGSQAQETFTKMEDMAKGNIASMIGVSNIFLEECVKQNAGADPFTHNKQSFSVSLYNGSTVNTLNSVAKNIVGIRSGFNKVINVDVYRDVYDKIPF